MRPTSIFNQRYITFLDKLLTLSGWSDVQEIIIIVIGFYMTNKIAFSVSNIFFHLPRTLRRVRVYKLLSNLPQPLEQKIQLQDGTTFWGDISHQGVMGTIVQQYFDREIVRAMSILLEKGDVFFDIGANFGLVTFSFLSRLHDSSIRCDLFEANPMLHGALINSTKFYSNSEIKVVNAIVTDTSTGHSYLRLNHHNSGASYVSSESGDYRAPHVTIDSYMEKENLHYISLMKIDVEGYEFKVLSGALKALNEGRVGAIILEVDSGHLERAGSSVSEVIGLLTHLGYSIFHWRAHDFSDYRWNGFRRDTSDSSTIHTGKYALRIAPLNTEKTPLNIKFGTDLLAVHKSRLDDLGII